jgi:aerobic-type carbon monoxide dehydrogenase small subunit (CoxS/CutS family)
MASVIEQSPASGVRGTVLVAAFMGEFLRQATTGTQAFERFFSTPGGDGIFVMPSASLAVMEQTITFTLNGQTRSVTTEPVRPLLEVLREDLDLTGTKYGCGEAQCGACTVLVDGVAVRSCVTAVGAVTGKQLTTIEGLPEHGRLHPVQAAFLVENAFQCGYCTPGMIMGLVGLLTQRPALSTEEILNRMDGHLCRCCGYPNIVKAIRRAVAEARR